MSRIKFGKAVDVTIYVLLAVSIVGAVFNKQIFEFIDKQQNSKVKVITQDEASKIKIGSESKPLNVPSSPSPTESSSSLGAQTNNSNSSYKPYVAGVCSRTPIPRSIEYEYLNYKYEGDDETIQGRDGYLETCTPDSNGFKIPDFRTTPINDVVYKGTKKQPSATPTSGYTYAEAYQLATSNCGVHGTANTGAFTQCIDAYMRQYGF